MSVTAEPPVAQASPEPRIKFAKNDDLWRALGEVPLHRIVLDPQPGTVTDDFYVKIDGRWNEFLVELVDGTLVEKPVGRRESRIGMEVGSILRNAIKAAGMGGKLSGADGMIRMRGRNIRMPDVAWTAPEDVTDPEEREAAPREAPTLAVEVISPDNTEKEMQLKLREYFASGCRLAWLLYPGTRTVHAYTSPDERRELGPEDTLDAGDVLPQFEVKVSALFDV